MEVRVVSQTKKLFSADDVDYLTVPSVKGSIQIFAGHYNMVSMLDLGVMEIVSKDKEKTNIILSSGFIEVNNDQITVLADSADLSQELIREQIEAAISRAESQISGPLPATELIQLEKQLRYERFKLEKFEQI